MANPSPVSASVTASPIVGVNDHYDVCFSFLPAVHLLLKTRPSLSVDEGPTNHLRRFRACGQIPDLSTCLWVLRQSQCDIPLRLRFNIAGVVENGLDRQGQVEGDDARPQKEKQGGQACSVCVDLLYVSRESKLTGSVRYLIHPDTTGDPQGLCIAAIKRALAPKACIVGPVLLSGETFDEGETSAFSSSKRVIVYILDSFYARGSGDLVGLWEAIGLLRGRIPERGYHDGLNVNLVVQVHSDRVREEWNVQHRPSTERLTNLDPLRFQKFDFHHGRRANSRLFPSDRSVPCRPQST